MAFTQLSVRSGHSFLRGGSTADDLCEQAANLGMEALAITDINGLYGVVPFVQAARGRGLRPITGVDLRERIPGPEGSDADGTESSRSRRGFIEGAASSRSRRGFTEGAEEDGRNEGGSRPRRRGG